MPLFMHQASFTTESWAKMAKQPQNRAEAMRQNFERLGGKLVSYWYCFGEQDVVVTSEMPDNTSAAAACIAACASGVLRSLKTTALISVDETMEAMRKAGAAGYVAPK